MPTLSVFCKRAAALALALLLIGAILRTAVSAEEVSAVPPAPAAEVTVPARPEAPEAAPTPAPLNFFATSYTVTAPGSQNGLGTLRRGDKADIAVSSLDFILSGDLLNQCAGSAYALRDSGAPYFGLYGACSTMAEALCLGALLIDGGAGEKVAALTS